jgi:hypothetical protein
MSVRNEAAYGVGGCYDTTNGGPSAAYHSHTNMRHDGVGENIMLQVKSLNDLRRHVDHTIEANREYSLTALSNDAVMWSHTIVAHLSASSRYTSALDTNDTSSMTCYLKHPVRPIAGITVISSPSLRPQLLHFGPPS